MALGLSKFFLYESQIFLNHHRRSLKWPLGFSAFLSKFTFPFCVLALRLRPLSEPVLPGMCEVFWIAKQ